MANIFDERDNITLGSQEALFQTIKNTGNVLAPTPDEFKQGLQSSNQAIESEAGATSASVNTYEKGFKFQDAGIISPVTLDARTAEQKIVKELGFELLAETQPVQSDNSVQAVQAVVKTTLIQAVQVAAKAAVIAEKLEEKSSAEQMNTALPAGVSSSLQPSVVANVEVAVTKTPAPQNTQASDEEVISSAAAISEIKVDSISAPILEAAPLDQAISLLAAIPEPIASEEESNSLLAAIQRKAISLKKIVNETKFSTKSVHGFSKGELQSHKNALKKTGLGIEFGEEENYIKENTPVTILLKKISAPVVSRPLPEKPLKVFSPPTIGLNEIEEARAKLKTVKIQPKNGIEQLELKDAIQNLKKVSVITKKLKMFEANVEKGAHGFSPVELELAKNTLKVVQKDILSEQKLLEDKTAALPPLFISSEVFSAPLPKKISAPVEVEATEIVEEVVSVAKKTDLSLFELLSKRRKEMNEDEGKRKKVIEEKKHAVVIEEEKTEDLTPPAPPPQPLKVSNYTPQVNGLLAEIVNNTLVLKPVKVLPREVAVEKSPLYELANIIPYIEEPVETELVGQGDDNEWE